MSVSDPFLRRPVLTLVVSLLIVMAGLLSLPGLQVENLPPIAPVRVNVRATYPGGGALAVEQGFAQLSFCIRGSRAARSGTRICTRAPPVDPKLSAEFLASNSSIIDPKS